MANFGFLTSKLDSISFLVCKLNSNYTRNLNYFTIISDKIFVRNKTCPTVKFSLHKYLCKRCSKRSVFF